jgi:hypothetical protein
VNSVIFPHTVDTEKKHRYTTYWKNHGCDNQIVHQCTCAPACQNEGQDHSPRIAGPGCTRKRDLPLALRFGRNRAEAFPGKGRLSAGEEQQRRSERENRHNKTHPNTKNTCRRRLFASIGKCFDSQGVAVRSEHFGAASRHLHLTHASERSPRIQGRAISDWIIYIACRQIGINAWRRKWRCLWKRIWYLDTL